MKLCPDCKRFGPCRSIYHTPGSKTCNPECHAAQVAKIYAQPLAVKQAIKHLRQARELLKSADAQQTLRRVRSAISSAYGAERNAYCRISRETRG